VASLRKFARPFLAHLSTIRFKEALMKSLAKCLLSASIIFLLAGHAVSQEVVSAGALGRDIQTLKNAVGDLVSPVVGGAGDRNVLESLNSKLQTLIKKRIRALREYQSLSAAMIGKAENEAIEVSLKKMERELKSLEGETILAAPNTPASAADEVEATRNSPVTTIVQDPVFKLSHPSDGRTDISTGEFFVSWKPASWATGFTVEINADRTFTSPSKFTAPVTCTMVGGISTCPSRLKIPTDALDAGVRYFWRVIADCNPAQAACPAGNRVVAANAPFSFSTVRQIGFFDYLSKKGFSLQKVVTGDDEDEGASFSFLRSFGDKTVYATDFALIWDSGERGKGRTRYTTEASVEGHLTSEESEAEDALRFGITENLVTSLSDTELTGLHSNLGGKLETDQKFTTKKLFFEATQTLTAANYFMGRYSRNENIKFRWRPYFVFQAGHTFRRGQSTVQENTVLRLIPRIHMDFRLDFISRALKIPRTLLFIDNTFYYLPIERDMKKTNFLTSGLEFDFTPNFGLAFNYKNGKSAPKFEHVHTFGGALTIRFGRNEQ
jgi:hypothetical protein